MIIRVLYANNTGADQGSLTNAFEVCSPENRVLKSSLTTLPNILSICEGEISGSRLALSQTQKNSCRDLY